MKKMLFSSMLVGSLVLPTVAFAAPDSAKKPSAHGEVMAKGHMPAGPRESHAMRMGQQLAAIETAIGIKSEQLNSWRAYTAALIDIMPQPPQLNDEQSALPAMIPGEWRADRIIEQAEKAKRFKTAAAALRRELSPEQLTRLNSFANEMRNPHGHAGKPDKMKMKMSQDHSSRSMGKTKENDAKAKEHTKAKENAK